MKLADLKKQAKSGDVILVRQPEPDHTLASETGAVIETVIAKATGGDYYHTGWLVWEGDVLKVDQMMTSGHERVPIEQTLAECSGVMCWGKFMEVISDQPERFIASLDRFANDPHVQKYGFSSLIKVWCSDVFGENFDPLILQPVCSLEVLDVTLDVLDGDIDKLWSPVDVADRCSLIEPIDP